MRSRFLLGFLPLFILACGTPKAPTSTPDAAAHPAPTDLPECITGTPEFGAELKATRLGEAEAGHWQMSAHAALIHLCPWGPDCPEYGDLLRMLTETIANFQGQCWPEARGTQGAIDIQCGPLEPLATHDGLQFLAAARIGDQVLAQRYSWRPTDPSWTHTTDDALVEDAAYELSHAGMPFLALQWNWKDVVPDSARMMHRFTTAILPGLLAGDVRKECRVTHSSDTLWRWESHLHYAGCGASGSWHDSLDFRFDPAADLHPTSFGQVPIARD